VILVDTSIWVDHFRAGDAVLADLLESSTVLGHPWVTGELALGRLGERRQLLQLLDSLPQAEVATPAEVAMSIEAHPLHGLGIGYVDAQLLAATRLTPQARLWTRDKRLAAAAARHGLLTEPTARH
jgi:predicted nucleic acid-binding protein